MLLLLLLSSFKKYKNFNEKLNNHKTVYHSERKRGNKINWVYSNQQSIKQTFTQGRADSKMKLEKRKWHEDYIFKLELNIMVMMTVFDNNF